MATCIHGFEQGQCLICQTLGSGPGAQRGTQVAQAERPRSSRRHRTPSGPVEARTPVEVVEDRTPRRRGGALTHILITAVLVVVAVVAFWAVAGLVFALLRLLEIVIVAAVAGVLGYRLGKARGHSDH